MRARTQVATDVQGPRSRIVTGVPPIETTRVQAAGGATLGAVSHASATASLPVWAVKVTVGVAVTEVNPVFWTWIATVMASAAAGAASVRGARIPSETVFLCHSFSEP